MRKRFGWKNDDPERIKRIVEALRIPTNGLLTEAEKAAALVAIFPDVFAIDRSELG